MTANKFHDFIWWYANELQSVPKSDVAPLAEVSVEEATLLKASADSDVEADAETADDQVENNEQVSDEDDEASADDSVEEDPLLEESVDQASTQFSKVTEGESDEDTSAVGILVKVMAPRTGNKAHKFFAGKQGRIILVDDHSEKPYQLEGMTSNKFH